jgi:hypothetical protein
VDGTTGNYCTDAPGAPPPAEAGCRGLDAQGACEGDVAVWCDGGALRTVDCAARAETCGWVDDALGYFCGGRGERPPAREPVAPEPPAEEPPAPERPADPCRGLDHLGACEGDVAVWCEDGRLQAVDCARDGQPCGWVDASTGYFCGGGGGGGAAPDPPPPGGDVCGSDVERAVTELANAARAAAGLRALDCGEAHARAARAHSQDMCDRGYFSHTGRDGSQPWDRLARAGGDFGAAGENIAVGYAGPEQVHRGWMTSPGHRANLLGRGYARIGVGFVACGGRNYWTQLFSD